MGNQIELIAHLLESAHNHRKPIEPIRNLIGIEDLDLAYKIQDYNIQKRIDAGASVVGKKIGLTSFAVQKQLGVDQPDYGVLLNTMESKDGTLSFSDLLQPKAEVEIAFFIDKDLDGDITMEQLKDAISGAAIAIEIVGSRVADWDIRITDTIADNASASHFIVGKNKVQLDEVDLVNCEMELLKDGEIASSGKGEACMDNPLNAALWLAQIMAKQGNPLRKGEVLLSGALGPMTSIEEGNIFKASISGLGEVQLAIT